MVYVCTRQIQCHDSARRGVSGRTELDDGDAEEHPREQRSYELWEVGVLSIHGTRTSIDVLTIGPIL